MIKKIMGIGLVLTLALVVNQQLFAMDGELAALLKADPNIATPTALAQLALHRINYSQYSDQIDAYLQRVATAQAERAQATRKIEVTTAQLEGQLAEQRRATEMLTKQIETVIREKLALQNSQDRIDKALQEKRVALAQLEQARADQKKAEQELAQSRAQAQSKIELLQQAIAAKAKAKQTGSTGKRKEAKSKKSSPAEAAAPAPDVAAIEAAHQAELAKLQEKLSSEHQAVKLAHKARKQAIAQARSEQEELVQTNKQLQENVATLETEKNRLANKLASLKEKLKQAMANKPAPAATAQNRVNASAGIVAPPVASATPEAAVSAIMHAIKMATNRRRQTLPATRSPGEVQDGLLVAEPISVSPEQLTQLAGNVDEETRLMLAEFLALCGSQEAV